MPLQVRILYQKTISEAEEKTIHSKMLTQRLSIFSLAREDTSSTGLFTALPLKGQTKSFLLGSASSSCGLAATLLPQQDETATWKSPPVADYTRQV